MLTEKERKSELILVRHGETDANAQDLWQGKGGDDPLNERGRIQSLATADYLTRVLPVNAIYSSDLRRAVETAEMIGLRLDLPVVTRPELQEYAFGFLEGATTSEAQERWQALLQKWRSDPTVKPPGGESALDFAVRVHGAFQEIVGRHASERVVVVGHGGSLSMGLAMLFGEPDRWQTYQMSNCGITIVAMATHPKVVAFDATAHLADVSTKTWTGASVGLGHQSHTHREAGG